MLISEKGGVRAVIAAHKAGFEIAVEQNRIAIYAPKWAMETTMRNLPFKVTKEIVEAVGYIPTESELIRKGMENQFAMEDTSEWRAKHLLSIKERCVSMRKVPVIFKDKWQVFVSGDGIAHAFSLEYLDMVDMDVHPDQYVTPDGMGYWTVSEDVVVIASGKFSYEDSARLRAFVHMYKDTPTYGDEEPENLSLFDDLEKMEN